jgi:hypothetical protein
MVSLLASGGMGEVWRGRDTLLQRDVAVKVLRSEYTGDPDFLARFRSEAQHTAGLTHPNIAVLHDYGEEVGAEVGSGRGGEHLAYLVMELVEGEPLSAVLSREQRLGLARTLAVVRATAAALAVAHAAGVIHRDVKPSNVLLGRDGSVKLTDFGIASSASSVPLTASGQLIGTAQYLSPERLQGARSGPPGDVYALGLVAYECLAGRRAFDGENPVQVAVKQIRESPAPLPEEVPEDVRRLVDRALAKDPADRFPDGAAFRDAVEEVLAGRSATAPRHGTRTAVMPVPSPAGAAPVTRRIPAPATRGSAAAGRRVVPLGALLALVPAAALAVGLVQALGGSPEPAPPTTAPVVQLTAGDHVGRPVAEVEAALTRMGLQVRLRPMETTDVPDGRVIAVDPVGDLAPGQAVTVTHALAPPPPAPPPVEDGGEDEAEEAAEEEVKKREEEVKKREEEREKREEEREEEVKKREEEREKREEEREKREEEWEGDSD